MLKILILDDHLLFVEGLCYILNALIDELIIFEASCRKEGLALVDCQNDLDLVLLGICLPGVLGWEALVEIKQSHPLLPVIIISASDNQTIMCEALTLGASGFIHKSTKGKTLLQIIRLVLSGETYIPSVLLSKLSIIVGETKPCQNKAQVDCKNEFYSSEIAPKLTLRQREILNHVANGFSNKEIASELCISEATVKSHVASVLRALDVTNRTQAAQAAFKLR
ncbi:MAG: response regulator transcription factor [Betaproteobacteria bacterium]|nr:response regulator transcription factor [Betaproteobacteria bacterium]